MQEPLINAERAYTFTNINPKIDLIWQYLSFYMIETKIKKIIYAFE